MWSDRVNILTDPFTQLQAEGQTNKQQNDQLTTLLNSKDSLSGHNLLHHSILRGDLTQLACHYIDVNSTTENCQNTALHLAVKGHKLDLVEYLINYGADKNARNVLGSEGFLIWWEVLISIWRG